MKNTYLVEETSEKIFFGLITKKVVTRYEVGFRMAPPRPRKDGAPSKYQAAIGFMREPLDTDTWYCFGNG